MELINILKYLLILLVTIIFILIVIFCVLKLKKASSDNKSMSNKNNNESKKNNNENKESIFKFMDFDNIEDNMIIQKNNTRFLMVIECQGINYDLMSGVEKAGVEEGFIQFLNTLRHPIQIYIQTRTINLESSLQTYKEKVDKIEEKLFKMRLEYEEMQNSNLVTEEQLNKMYFELIKQTNLYEYGKDIIYDTEKMSFNKNILNKKYYIIIPYYSMELGNDKLGQDEVKNMAFSELYTRAQSIIRAISLCDVKGKILSSNELIELLYMAYNRDEAEVFGLDKAIKAGYDDIYTTAPDVLNKKMRELDKLIEEKAVEKAREKVDEIKTEKQKEIEEKEDKLDFLIDEMAKIILKENKRYIGKEIANEAIEKIEKESKIKEGGIKDDKEKKTRKRRTSSK